MTIISGYSMVFCDDFLRVDFVYKAYQHVH